MVGEQKVTVRSRILGALLVFVGFYALAVIVLRWLGGVAPVQAWLAQFGIFSWLVFIFLSAGSLILAPLSGSSLYVVGRTVPVWNRYYRTADFTQPWLLRFFDQIRFFPVTGAELQRYREDVTYGRVKLDIHEETFHLGDYQQFLQDHAASIQAFKTQQQNAFHAERERWVAAGEFDRPDTEAATAPLEATEIPIPPGQVAVRAEVSGTVWQVVVTPQAVVHDGEKLMIIEAMKTEIAVLSPLDATVAQILCQPGQPVTAGQIVLLLIPAA